MARASLDAVTPRRRLPETTGARIGLVHRPTEALSPKVFRILPLPRYLCRSAPLLSTTHTSSATFSGNRMYWSGVRSTRIT